MMTARKDASHLRLIYDQEKIVGPANVCLEPPEQLSLGLDAPEQSSIAHPERLAFILALVTTMNWRDFVDLISGNMTSWVIDVRVAPRFDTLAWSRETAFRIFQEQNAIYVDLFGRLKVKSYRSAALNPVIWGRELCTMLVDSEREGPYMLLFDDRALMVSAGNVLPAMAQEALGSKVNFRRIITST